ncbi:MAG: hypothetical protein J6W52_11230 [Bacteroidaceae bacterium]|nr:hypothetical protein [Bacteroidaceae bacterium]
MTFRITIFSQEVEDFVMEAKIDAEAKFAELHNLILSTCKYQDTNNHGFLICDEEWRVKEHIRQTNTKDIGSEEDIYLMQNCYLRDFLEEEGQRIAYIFDPEGKRFFLMEISEIIFGHPEKTGRISRMHGAPPVQHINEDAAAQSVSEAAETEMEEDFYGDDDFEEGELDMEGFEINE